MDAAKATQWGLMIAAVLAALGGWGTTWLNRRNAVDGTTLSLAQLDEQKRQSDINLIITTLQSQVEDLQGEVKEVKRENAEISADRDQMRGELRRVKMRLDGVERENGTLRAQLTRLTGLAAGAEADASGDSDD